MKKLIIIGLTLLVVSSCKHDEYDWIDRSKHEGLIKINYSEKFETYATQSNPGNLEATIKNLELAKSYFDKVFYEDLNFAVLFIDNQNWDKYTFVSTRGMPQAYYEGNIVLGLNKSEMAIGFEQALAHMPQQATQELKKYFGEPIDLDKFFRDGLALHELGHLYQFYRTGSNYQRHWLNELFGNLCQVAAAKNFEDKSTFNQMDSFQTLLINGNQWGNLKYTSLEQFENNYFDVMKEDRNYGWYQTRFFTIAKELHNTHGDDIISKFREFLITTDPATFGKIGDEQLNNMLLIKFGPEVMKTLKWKSYY